MPPDALHTCHDAEHHSIRWLCHARPDNAILLHLGHGFPPKMSLPISFAHLDMLLPLGTRFRQVPHSIARINIRVGGGP